jgi:hypothetical protein
MQSLLFWFCFVSLVVIFHDVWLFSCIPKYFFTRSPELVLYFFLVNIFFFFFFFFFFCLSFDWYYRKVSFTCANFTAIFNCINLFDCLLGCVYCKSALILSLCYQCKIVCKTHVICVKCSGGGMSCMYTAYRVPERHAPCGTPLSSEKNGPL